MLYYHSSYLLVLNVRGESFRPGGLINCFMNNEKWTVPIVSDLVFCAWFGAEWSFAETFKMNTSAHYVMSFHWFWAASSRTIMKQKFTKCCILLVCSKNWGLIAVMTWGRNDIWSIDAWNIKTRNIEIWNLGIWNIEIRNSEIRNSEIQIMGEQNQMFCLCRLRRKFTVMLVTCCFLAK